MTALRPPRMTKLVVDAVTARLADADIIATVTSGLPSGWKPGATPHVRVSRDGTVRVAGVVATGTFRLVAYTNSPTASEDLAAMCEALLLAFGGTGLGRFRTIQSVAVARDDETKGEIASVVLDVDCHLVPA